MKKRRIGFKGLARKVDRRYRREGVPPGEAIQWAEGTAGKVRAEQLAEKKRRNAERRRARKTQQAGFHHKAGCQCAVCDPKRRAKNLAKARKRRWEEP